VGWDVALTPAGPVLIEGNPDWDLPMVQVHTRGLLQPEVRKQLARFGITYPENTLPRISPCEWSVWLSDTRNHSVVRQLYQRLGRTRRAQ